MAKAIGRKVTVQGKVFGSLESAAKAFGKSRNTVDYRLSKGWSPEQALGIEPPPNFSRRTAGIAVRVLGQEFKTLKDAARFYGRAYTHAIEMLKKGRSIEQALGLTKRADTLETEYPELASQWHPSKNLPLTPADVSWGSGKKVWWLCSKNHEWQAVINSRKSGMGCPFCAGQRPTIDRNFATVFPELLSEWHWEKNGSLDPKTLAPRANRKIWWKCERGHSWQATILNKTRTGYKGDCPYCLNRKLSEDNSLEKLRPDIAKDWHPTKNGTLTPRDVIAGGSKKVWWVCKHNHEWLATVGARVHNGQGCPNCSLQTSRIEIAIYSEIVGLFPNVSWREKVDGYECDILIKDKKIGIELDGVYWHKNRSTVDMTKQELFKKKGIQLFRLREKGLELLSERDIPFTWSDDTFPIVARLAKQIIKFAHLDETESSRLKDYIRRKTLINEKQYREIVAQLPAPPPELSLAIKFPDIAKEWAHDLNAPLLPEHFRPGASKSVWWRCDRGHTWKTSLNNRTNQGTGCPTCPRVKPITVTGEWNFAAVKPKLAKEWNYARNGRLKPEDARPYSNNKVWWICAKGHEWQATPSARTSGSGCPSCSGRSASRTNNLLALFPELLEEWDKDRNNGRDPSDFTPYSPKKIWWKCTKVPGHAWQASIYSRTKLKSGCPKCARKNSRKYTIEYFREFARKRGGKCLSKEYLSCRNKLKMKCRNGHIWETRADNVLYEQTWCPRCKKNEVSAQLTLF